ncbi:MAG TPA: CaiB/BaiF CoA-transferase family protein [Bacteroidia bacterium]|jgi:crotonobetainyl-CoA:carnitine CoA-transferase CaiB-like acyl-CoA transferase|nr:CaiB/BaiF CoA-transferase family protein [Bacteroidia bacterium]
MKQFFSNLKVIELAGVLAGPSVGVFFAELGAKVIKIENPKTKGDVTRSWKSFNESPNDKESAYYWSINTGKEILFLDITQESELQKLYALIKNADIIITNYKKGDDIKLKVSYSQLRTLNTKLIYASISSFGSQSTRTAYDLILQAEAGFMLINGEPNSDPVKMPVALIDMIAGHQLKEAILIALLEREKTGNGFHIDVSLFDAAVVSLVNQATNWLIGSYLPQAMGSLHPNIAPYGELFSTKDYHTVTFAIGNDKQFSALCELLDVNEMAKDAKFNSNQSRIQNRDELYEKLNIEVEKINFDDLYKQCLKKEIPIGKLRNLKEVFELPEAKALLKQFSVNGQNKTAVNSIAFKFIDHV